MGIRVCVVFWLKNAPLSGLTSARNRCSFPRDVVANRAREMVDISWGTRNRGRAQSVSNGRRLIDWCLAGEGKRLDQSSRSSLPYAFLVLTPRGFGRERRMIFLDGIMSVKTKMTEGVHVLTLSLLEKTSQSESA